MMLVFFFTLLLCVFNCDGLTWNSISSTDCGGADIGRSSGNVPEASYCTSLDNIAVCWDGIKYFNHGDKSLPYPWCTYKSVPGGSCSGGGAPGLSFHCDAELTHTLNNKKPVDQSTSVSTRVDDNGFTVTVSQPVAYFTAGLFCGCIFMYVYVVFCRRRANEGHSL